VDSIGENPNVIAQNTDKSLTDL